MTALSSRALLLWVFMGLTLGLGFWLYERKKTSPVLIAAVSSLAAIATAGRIAFSFIPGFQPATLIVAVAGCVLGPAHGFMTGSVTAFLSNMFLGQGPWTVWQMAAWGAVGLSAGLFGRLKPAFTALDMAVFTGLWGLLFGAIMNVWHWLSFTYPPTRAGLVAVFVASASFDILHAAGNVVLSLAFGGEALRILRRFGRRLSHLVGPVLVVALVMGSVAVRPAHAMSSQQVEGAIARAMSYLMTVQNADGGFPYKQGEESDVLNTSWAVMGLRAVGLDPDCRMWQPAGKTAADFLLASEEFQDFDAMSSTDLARSILAMRAFGFAQEDHTLNALTKELSSRQRSNGQFAGVEEEMLLNAHIWAIIALRNIRGGIKNPVAAKSFLLGAQNADGGFAHLVGDSSDPDDTAAAVQAMVVMGETGSPLLRALEYLENHMSGAKHAWQTTEPNSATSAWILQALNATKPHYPELVQSLIPGVLEHLCSLQGADGSFKHTEKSGSMPVWMTSQAMAGLSGLSFPLATGFWDVPPAHSAFESVSTLMRKGIVNGYEDGTFGVSSDLSRAEFAALISRVVDSMQAKLSSVAATEQPFSDVPLDHWAAGYVQKARDLGLMQGIGDSLFAPDKNVTSAEVLTVGCRLLDLEVPAVEKAEPWYAQYVAVAEQAGIADKTMVAPDPATRGQCAHTLLRVLQLAR